MSTRIQWIDLARGTCILLVLLFHTSAALEFSELPYPSLFNIINDIFAPFRMPLLMFLSGMLLHKSFKKDATSYLRRKFYLIFCPFLFWSMLIYTAENRLTLEYIVKTPISAPSLLWYLWFLFAYYVIALFLRPYFRFLPYIIGACLLLSEILPDFIRMSRFSFLFAFFLLGHYYMSEWSQKISSRDWRAAVVGLLAAAYGSYLSLSSNDYLYKNAFYSWTQFGAIAFTLWASTYYRSNQLTKPLEWVGRNAIVFYVTHFPAQIYAAKLIMLINLNISDASVYIIVFSFSVFIGMAIHSARRRIPIIAALFDFSTAIFIYKNSTPRYNATAK